MMLIHHGPPQQLSPQEQRELWAAWAAVRETPGVTPGIQLGAPGTAAVVRVRGGRTMVTDGPFAETKDAIGGRLLFEGDRGAALALAERIPVVRQGGAVEVRPLVEHRAPPV